jgi:hypothetical protein
MAASDSMMNRQEDLSNRTATEHDALLTATHSLERALARPAWGRKIPEQIR